MAAPSQLAQLLERRRLLVARSAELRQEFVQDLTALQSSTAWYEKGLSIVRSGRVILPIVAGVAGLAVGHRRQGMVGKALRVASWMRLGSRLVRLWR